MEQPSVAAPTPLQCALQTSAAVAGRLQTQASQAASDLDVAISIVRGNGQLSQLTESQNFIREAKRLADHQRRIAHNYNAAKDVCARAEADVVGQPDQVREALERWISDKSCGYNCTTLMM